VHQVDVALEVVLAGLPVSDSAISHLVGSLRSTLVVLNHDHELVDLVLVVKVDSHVTLDSQAFNSHSVVVDTALEAVELGLALVLLLT
jgi:hypothetical protein